MKKILIIMAIFSFLSCSKDKDNFDDDNITNTEWYREINSAIYHVYYFYSSKEFRSYFMDANGIIISNDNSGTYEKNNNAISIFVNSYKKTFIIENDFSMIDQESGFIYIKQK